MIKVVVVTVTYGDRWKFLSQVIDSVINDIYLEKLIIVDNASVNKNEIDEYVCKNKEKIILIRSDKNIGSAGGFALGLESARAVECEYVFTLDDDNVPEVGAIQMFLDHIKEIKKEKIVLCGNRLNLLGNQEYFYNKILEDTSPRGTFFEVFSANKIIHFLNFFVGKHVKKNEVKFFKPIVPNESFIYGGVFMPIEAVRNAPLPDATLVLYGDDIEYSWGVKKLGYDSYLCSTPRIYDIDSSFGDSHIFGLFKKETKAFKVYYRIRNMVRVSVRNTKQSKIALFLNIIFWVAGLCILGLFKYGATNTYLRRVKLIVQAVYGGYVIDYITPKEAELP